MCGIEDTLIQYQVVYMETLDNHKRISSSHRPLYTSNEYKIIYHEFVDYVSIHFTFKTCIFFLNAYEVLDMKKIEITKL